MKRFWKILLVVFMVLVFLVGLSCFVFLDSSDTLSKIHISIQSWVTAVSTILTISFSFWLLTIQRKNEKMKKLLDRCLSNKIFSLIYSNDNHTYSFNVIKDKFVIGADDISNFELLSFFTLIQIISTSGLVNRRLKKNCIEFLRYKKKYFTTSYLNENRCLFPMLEINLLDQKAWIFSKEYYAFLDYQYKYLDVIDKDIYDDLIKNKNIDHLFKKMENLRVQDFGHLINLDQNNIPIFKSDDVINKDLGVIAYSRYNNTIKLFDYISSQYKNENADVSFLNFIDGIYFPEKFNSCIVYTLHLKNLCSDIVTELS